MATAGPRPTIRWRTVRVDHPYVYYHCTGHRGPCGNTYVREEELVRQFGEILNQVRIPAELAGKLATVLRESQSDKEKFVRTSMLRLQQPPITTRGTSA
jgi:hypothetical protein